MTTTIGPITLILDLRKQIARSREVLEVLQRRVSLALEYQRRTRYSFSSSI